MPRPLIMLCRVAIGAIFLLAAWMKLQPGSAMATGPQLFAQSIESFKLAPDWMIGPTAFILPWLEALCGVLLVLGLWTRAAASIAATLMVVFTVAVVIALLRQMKLSCGCFGNLNFLWCPKTTMGWCKVSENAFMFALAAVPAIFGAGMLAIDAVRTGATPAISQPSAPPKV